MAGVFRLADLRAGAVITPRTAIEWLDLEDAAEETRRKITGSTYARVSHDDRQVAAQGGVTPES